MSRRNAVSVYVALAVVAALPLGVYVQPATAAVAGGPGLAIRSLAQPTNFSTSDNAHCSKPQAFCDSYTLVIQNVGSAPTSGTIRITDLLPRGLAVERIKGTDMAANASERTQAEKEFTCSASPLECTYSRAVAADDTLLVKIEVEVEAGFNFNERCPAGLGASTGCVTNSATVEGGGAPTASTSEPATVPNTVDGAPPSFGIQDFSFNTYDADGAPDLQAGDRPYELTASFDFNSHLSEWEEVAPRYQYVEPEKDVVVYLPLGLVGDPLAAARCRESELTVKGKGCPLDSRVGTIVLNFGGDMEGSIEGGKAGNRQAVYAIYNMVPEHGYPAVFGFSFYEKEVLMYASVVHTASGYDLRVAVPGIVRVIGFGDIDGVSVSFFGDPNAQNESGAPLAFLTNPVDCSGGPLRARIEADSWVEPEAWQSKEAVVYPQLNGCNVLQFQPALEVRPEERESVQADVPSGYDFDLKLPQAPNFAPALATPELESVTATLPPGVSASPGVADGLVGCPAEGPEGINIGSDDTAAAGRDLGDPYATELGEGRPGGDGSPYDDGLYHVAPGHCPQASQIGTVEVVTPLLESKLEGRVYLGKPECEPCTEADDLAGRLFKLYIEAEGSGVVVKLAGTAVANPQTGQLTATFAENPQLPFSELRLQFNGGPRAPLASPQTCGEATTFSDFSPWGSPASPDATSLSSFEVTGCENRFSPAFEAGTTTPLAGGYSPLVLKLERHDGEQDLADISVQTPPGLLGKIANVPLCEEPQASSGQCSSASQIGTATVAAGAGSHPFWISGPVYLTGAYGGAPFGLSIAVPAKAGPFNLGTVVVRAAIHIDPHSTALTVVSSPIPQIRDGVPFRIQTVDVTIDRPEFILNPTNCDQQSITGTIASAQGGNTSVSSPFAVGGCANLPFSPKFTVATQANTSRLDGASLDVKIGYVSGQTNIHSVEVILPKKLPARLSTLSKSCTEAAFNANPAGCPATSVVGTATAVTPLLKQPLIGPAYFVSHGGAAFPDLVVVLQGQGEARGVTVDLEGGTFISKLNVTSSKFTSVPDVPIFSFELKLPEGPHSALTAVLPGAAKGSLCGTNLMMPTMIEGQNGARIEQNTKIAVSGCPKVKKVKRRAKAKKTKKTKTKKKK